MTADGFLNQRQRHPVAMTAAIAINLAAITAVLLAKSGYVVRTPDPFTLIDPTEPPVPEPIVEQPKPNSRAKSPFVPPRQVPSKGDPTENTLTGAGTLPPIGDGGVGTTPRTDPMPTPTPSATPEPVTVGAEPLPSAIREFQPPYPSQLLRTGVEGKVVVRVLIGTDGRVKQVAIIVADDPFFADATERQALRKWRFKPATRDGTPIESWKQMTVRFEIKP